MNRFIEGAILCFNDHSAVRIAAMAGTPVGLLGLLGGMLVFSHASFAQTVPPAVDFRGQAYAGGWDTGEPTVVYFGGVTKNVTGVGTFSSAGSGPAGGFGSAEVTVKLDPTPTLALNAGTGAFNGSTVTYARGAAALDYSFRIVGPTSWVPIIVHTVGSATLSTPIAASAWGSLYALSEARVDNAVIGGACADAPLASTCKLYVGVTSFDVTKTIPLYSGNLHSVSLNVSGVANSAGNFGAGAQYLSAFVDPLITIDPSFPDADKYALEFSPGVFNLAPVPEPESFALMLSGLGVLGAATRRNRRTRVDG